MVLHYEAVTLGIQAHLKSMDPEDAEQMSRARDLFAKLKNDSRFKQQTRGGGKNRPGALNERVRFVEDYLTAHLFVNTGVADYELARNPIQHVKDLDTSTWHTYMEEEPNSLTPDEVPLFLAKVRELYPPHFAMVAP